MGKIAVTWRSPRSYDEASLAGVERVDVVISPCVNQNLSAFPLVLGNDNIARLCARLRPRVLVPLTNAEFEAEGAHCFCGISVAHYESRDSSGAGESGLSQWDLSWRPPHTPFIWRTSPTGPASRF